MPPRQPLSGAQKSEETSEAEVAPKAEEVPHSEICRRVLLAAFEYLSALALSPPTTGRDAAAPEARQAEVLQVALRMAAENVPADAELLHLPLRAATGQACISPEGKLIVKVRSLLAVPLEVGEVSASTSLGAVQLTSAVLEETKQWHAGQQIELSGSLPAVEAGRELPREIQVTSVSLKWASVSQAHFLLGNISPCLTAAGTTKSVRGLLAEKAVVCRLALTPETSDARELLQAKVVDPATTGLVGEPFILNVAVAIRKGATTSGLKLRIWGRVGQDAMGKSSSSSASLSLVSSSKDAWSYVALPDTSHAGVSIATVQAAGIEPCGGNLSLPLDRCDPILPFNCSDDEVALLVPIIVQAHSHGELLLDFAVDISGSDSETGVAASITIPRKVVLFQTPLQGMFEQVGNLGSNGEEHWKVVLKSLTKVSVNLKKVGSNRTGEQQDALDETSILGSSGRVEPGSSHGFSLLVDSTSPSKPTHFAVHFERADAVKAFFPSPSCHAQLPQAPLPHAILNWPLPEQSRGPEKDRTELQVNLEHSATGYVAEPIVVQVHLECSAEVPQDVKLKVLTAKESDYFIRGPTTVDLLWDPAKARGAVARFDFVPLKPGWITMPKVQVLCALQEYYSSQGSVFVHPGAQPMLKRNIR
eukprot:gnl/MRDRNA2_/MRDRNA2_62269_c0_seq1.p1 gnl/MRDRNA2_/MRDRNA2_62269_c0~~gnl/MRDRNA2_/MRDRNA2_62269_c0_seq1.p1  ORF type:complete len:671 (-),score=120.22 gnl/MRDRNA2_/MRDRNA2_62269_c0_seq1:26-1966(-)